MGNEVKKILKADNGKLYVVLEYETGERVEIPINKDGTIKWLDDSTLLKQEGKENKKIHSWIFRKWY